MKREPVVHVIYRLLWAYIYLFLCRLSRRGRREPCIWCYVIVVRRLFSQSRISGESSICEVFIGCWDDGIDLGGEWTGGEVTPEERIGCLPQRDRDRDRSVDVLKGCVGMNVNQM